VRSTPAGRTSGGWKSSTRIGGFFWSTVTFAQQKLITGAFGPLELSHTGERYPIKEETIDK